MTTATAVHPVATPRDVRFVQALCFLVVVASIGTAVFISMANSDRSLDDVFVASNGGINRVSSDGAARVDWVVNMDNPLTAYKFRNDPEEFVRRRWTITQVEQTRLGGPPGHQCEVGDGRSLVSAHGNRRAERNRSC